MYCHGTYEFEQSRLTQFNFKALLNKAKSFISKPPSCLVLMSVVYFISGGLWPQIKSNTILFTSSTKSFGVSITLQINTSLESARDFTRFILP